MPKVKIGDKLLYVRHNESDVILEVVAVSKYMAFVHLDGKLESVSYCNIMTRPPRNGRTYVVLLQNIEGNLNGRNYKLSESENIPLPSVSAQNKSPEIIMQLNLDGRLPELRSLPKVPNIDITRAVIRHIQMIAVGGIIGVIIAYFLF